MRNRQPAWCFLWYKTVTYWRGTEGHHILRGCQSAGETCWAIRHWVVQRLPFLQQYLNMETRETTHYNPLAPMHLHYTYIMCIHYKHLKWTITREDKQRLRTGAFPSVSWYSYHTGDLLTDLLFIGLTWYFNQGVTNRNCKLSAIWSHPYDYIIYHCRIILVYHLLVHWYH